MSAEDILKLILGSAGALVCLVLAVRWLTADRDKLAAKLDAAQAARMISLEEQSKRCAEDRQEQGKQLASLQVEVRELYKSMLAAALTEGASAKQLAQHMRGGNSKIPEHRKCSQRVTSMKPPVLTCSVCSSVREPQPHETLPDVGAQAHAYCSRCNQIRMHVAGVKRALIEQEFARRAP